MSFGNYFKGKKKDPRQLSLDYQKFYFWEVESFIVRENRSSHLFRAHIHLKFKFKRV